MGRQPQPERRADVLAAAVEYVLAHGLADLSLRPLAAASGTSPRMLLYHFGSREGLIAEVVAAAGDRQRAMLGRALAADATPAELLARYWRWLSSEEADRYVRLFFEVYALALQGDAYSGFLRRLAEDWSGFIERRLARAGLSADEARVEATLVMGATRGLMLDLLAIRLTGGDRRRVDAAMARVIERLAERTSPAVADGVAEPPGQHGARPRHARGDV